MKGVHMSEETFQKIKEVYGEEFLLKFREEVDSEANSWIDNHLKTLLKRFEYDNDFLSFIQYFMNVLKEENKSIVNASFLSSHIKKFNMQLCSDNENDTPIEKEDEADELEEDFLNNESLSKQMTEIQDSLTYIRNDVQEGFYDVGEIKLDSSTTNDMSQITLQDIKEIKGLLEALRNTKSKRPRQAEYQQIQELERLFKESKNKQEKSLSTIQKVKGNIGIQSPIIYVLGGTMCLMIILLFLVLLKV